MVVIRNSMISKLSCVLAVVAMASIDVNPVQAQQYAGTRNSAQGTIGDISDKKLNPQIRRLPGLNFRPAGLFGDAEVFPVFGTPDPFIFALPNFSGAGLDFSDMTFDEYLNLVANSYSLTDSSDYLFRFQVQNAFTFETGYVPNFNEIFQVHQSDFVAGGGYLPLPGNPVQPVLPPDEPTEPVDPPVFTPFPTGDDPVDPPAGDTSAATLLEESGVLTDTELADAIEQLEAAGNSQDAADPAARVVNVPEPATLGLLLAAGTTLIGRRRH